MTTSRVHELTKTSLPLVSLVLPVKDEALYLARTLDAVSAQAYPPERIEILVVDGGSTDGTLDLLNARATKDPRIRVLGGPGVTTPLAMNVGAEAATGSLIAKIDGHGFINAAFISEAVQTLLDHPGVGCVGGLIVPIANGDVERSIAYARFSMLGVGGGIYTASDHLQEADTVQCGVYRREALLEAGGFDPLLVFGEDEEANYRIRRAGWKILLQPRMRFSYQVRHTHSRLFRQYFHYGRARIAVIRKHPHFFRPKHAVPTVVVGTLAAAAATLANEETRPLGALVWLAYAATVAGGGAVIAAHHQFKRPDLVALSLAALHIGYGLGTIAGLVDLVRTRKTGSTVDPLHRPA